MKKMFRIKMTEVGVFSFVDADYFRIEAGVLIFRNTGHGNNYPEAVHVFAAGVWAEVEPLHE